MTESASLVLVGGGHAHLAVLADWIREGPPCANPILITPSPYLRYSGMVPGWISGMYARDEGVVDVAALTEKAGAQLLLDRCVAIDADRREFSTERGHTVAFNIASIDAGGVGRASNLIGDDPRLLDIRPIDRFVDRWAALRRQIADRALHVLVAGGGAGGTELAFALRNMAGVRQRPRVSLALGDRGLLPDFAAVVRAKAARELAHQAIVTMESDAWLRSGEFGVGDRAIEPVDLVVAALGSTAPPWLLEGGLRCAEGNFMVVDRYQRSVSHPHVFGVGDIAMRRDRQVPHSGVHAVSVGPILAQNLRAAIMGQQPSASYTPRASNLYLMSTGNGSAIASYGPFAAEGRWVAKLKDWIDRRWIDKYRSLATQ